jgi:hypothetical protein
MEAGPTKVLTGKEAKAFILAETKEGGKLDFFTPIKAKSMIGFRSNREYSAPTFA